MIKYCPNCGIKLEKEYKYCPSCGYDLTGINLSDASSQLHEFIICENCGEENNPSNEVCSSCGAVLKGKRVTKKTPPSVPVEEKKYEKQKQFSDSKKKKKEKNISSAYKSVDKPAAKGLTQGQIITIISAAILIAVVLLVSSGIFDSPVSTNNISTPNNQSSGVDLNNLQKINQLEEQLKNNPNNDDLMLQLAHLKNDSGLYEQAIINYKQYLAINPKDADARIDMGICYYNLRDFQTAITQMKEALKYEPNHQIGYLNLGIVNLTAGNNKEAKSWLEKTIKIDPNTEYAKRAEELLKSQ